MANVSDDELRKIQPMNLMLSHRIQHQRYYVTEIYVDNSRACIVVVETNVAYIIMA